MVEQPKHFHGKEAIEHVAEAHAQGILSSAEIHGTEIPGHISAAADAARETAIILTMLWILLAKFHVINTYIASTLTMFSIGWLFWKGCRSAWLGWSRLERMHRVVEQERWEIQHHRGQERAELKELYAAKGLTGKLLDDVIDVLMADEERLLNVMVVEELCLSLESHEHPLKQSFGALIGVSLTSLAIILSLLWLPAFGVWIGAIVTMAISAYYSATYEGNKRIPAIVWNLGFLGLSAGSLFFLLEYVK